MTPEVQFIIGIAVTIIIAIVGILLSILAYLASRHLSSIDDKLNVLPAMQTQIAEVKVTQKHHTEKQEEFCERLERVESHVNNTERVVSLEKKLEQVDKDRTYERDHRHWVAGVIQNLALHSGVKIEPQP
jgi:hypothetical protein